MKKVVQVFVFFLALFAVRLYGDLARDPDVNQTTMSSTDSIAESQVKSEWEEGTEVITLLPGTFKQPAIGEYVTELVPKDSEHIFITFLIDMFLGGLHMLSVFVICGDNPPLIQIGESKTVYSIKHFDQTIGVSGQQCLELFSHIDAATTDCTEFRVVFQGVAIDTKMIIENIQFVAQETAPECPSVNN